MNFLRKFHDAEAQVNEGGGGINIAEIMAQKGVLNNTDQMVAEPLEIKPDNQGEFKPDATLTPDATSNVEEKKEEAKPESQQQPEVKVEEPKPVEVATPPTVEVPKQETWQEVLKKQPNETVLKELLGVDDDKVSFVKEMLELDPKMVAFLQTWKKDGDVKGYLREMTTDYQKMNAEEVMRHQLRQEYPKASEAQLNAIFKREIIEAYKLDAEVYSAEEVAEGQLLLDAKADKYRDGFVANQEKFLLPKPPEEKPLQPVVETQPEVNHDFENYKLQLTDNQLTKEVFDKKYLTIGEGDDKFNLPIAEPNALTEVLFDSAKWAAAIFDKKVDATGKETFVPKTAKQLLIAAIATDDVGTMREIARYYKELGGSKTINSIDNAKVIENNGSPINQKSDLTPAQAMAKGGVLK